MSEVISLPDCGYRYIAGVFQYSGGVAALPGFTIVRVRLHRPLLLADGFAAVESHLKSAGLSPTAFCACELRSPAPFTEEGFEAFNRQYVQTLQRWGVIRNGANPVARTNVCPDLHKPSAPSLYAFSYAKPDADSTGRGFVIAGSGEAPEGRGNYRDHVIRPGDRSTDGLREKARWVLGEMERRMAALGFTWADATGTHLYTVHDVHPFLGEEIALRGAMACGLSWHFARPPVQDLDYEMDVRGVAHEHVLARP